MAYDRITGYKEWLGPEQKLKDLRPAEAAHLGEQECRREGQTSLTLEIEAEAPSGFKGEDVGGASGNTKQLRFARAVLWDERSGADSENEASLRPCPVHRFRGHFQTSCPIFHRSVCFQLAYPMLTRAWPIGHEYNLTN